MKVYLAMDLGATFIKFGLVTPEGTIIDRGKLPTQAEGGPERLADRAAAQFKTLLSRNAGAAPQGLAVSAPGVIRPRQGILVNAPNLGRWKEVPFAGLMADRLGVPTRLANDGDMCALGEWLAGAGRGLGSLVALTLGTGVGGGIMLNNQLWQGCGATAAELGHVIIEPDGPPCECGGTGCLERYASAAAIARTARQAIENGEPCGYRGDPADLTSEILYDLALEGDALALKAFDRAGWALGIGLTDVFNLLGLEGAIIGGGATAAFRFIYPKLYEEFSARVLAVDPAQVRIVPAALGNDAQLVGAAALFNDQ